MNKNYELKHLLSDIFLVRISCDAFPAHSSLILQRLQFFLAENRWKNSELLKKKKLSKTVIKMIGHQLTRSWAPIARNVMQSRGVSVIAGEFAEKFLGSKKSKYCFSSLSFKDHHEYTLHSL